MHSSTVVLESQPDWLTATLQGGNRVRAANVHIDTLLLSEKVHGNRVLPFRVGEYVGQRCGRIRVGQFNHKLLVQLSGDLASTQFDWFTKRADRLTRLDLAVTVRTQRYEPDIAERMFHEAQTYRNANARSAVPSLVLNGAGGSTCYVGKRTSDRFFRAYDKDAECRASDDVDALDRYRNAWRFELELHDDAATSVAYALPPAPGRAGWIANYIAGYQQAHGQTPIYDPTAAPVHVGGFRRRTDRESRLDWLSRSVAPTVRWLVDSTPRDELLKRLGLAEEGDASG